MRRMAFFVVAFIWMGREGRVTRHDQSRSVTFIISISKKKKKHFKLTGYQFIMMLVLFREGYGSADFELHNVLV